MRACTLPCIRVHSGSWHELMRSSCRLVSSTIQCLPEEINSGLSVTWYTATNPIPKAPTVFVSRRLSPLATLRKRWKSHMGRAPGCRPSRP